MITNPSQRQLDLMHEKDIAIEVGKTTGFRIIEAILDKLTGNVPEKVIYRGKQYRSNELIIYTKEELASMRNEQIKGIIGPEQARYKTVAEIKLTGNINRVAITTGNTTIRLNYNDLYYFLKQIQNQYDTAVNNSEQFQYDKTAIYTLSSFTDHKNLYEFVNGFELEVAILKDIQTKKYTATENMLQIKLSEQYDTPAEADNAIKKVIAARLELMKDYDKAYLIYKHKVVEEQEEQNDEISNKNIKKSSKRNN